jgi:hypothetical protein
MAKHVFMKAVSFVLAIALLAGLGAAVGLPSLRALSVPSVTVTPSVVGETAKYTVEFTLGAALESGDEIWFHFPEGTYLPCTSCNPRILQTTVTVNGVYPILPSIGNASLRSKGAEVRGEGDGHHRPVCRGPQSHDWRRL